MKRKLILLLTAAAACMLVLTACTSSDTVNKKTEQGTNVSQPAENNAGGQNPDAGENLSADVQEENEAPEQGEPGYDGEPDGEVIPDEDVSADGNDQAVSDIWSGFYEDTDESVSVQLLEDGNISFSFGQSGIGGIAEVNGTQAVFHGDDYHVVVFNVSGNTLDISVSSEEDFDASTSPLNGTYTRN